MKARNEVTVGIVVILSLIIVVVGTVWLQGRGFGREETELRARFYEVGQLLEGNSVKVSGVPIGRVASIDLDPAAVGVIVTMRVRADVRMPEDPVALLSLETMFGDWQAEILARADAERMYPSSAIAESPDPAILPGATLPDISRLTAVADRIAGNMADLSDRFQIAFTDETATNIRRAIENIQRVSQRLTDMVASQQQAVEGVAADLQRTAGALGEAVATINRTFAQVETAISGDKLINIVASAERASLKIDSLAVELLETSRALGGAAVSADTTLRSVGAVADAMLRGQGSLGLLLRDSALYWRIVESNTELQEVLKDLRANPRKYINLRIF
jgi:phospholipid/cholesterol/gamma-HCH transport system substrate-binding protein